MDLSPVDGQVTEADWIRFKEAIRELYLVEDRNLLGDNGVRKHMNDLYGFDQT
jgi:hypothetical protein